MYVFLLVLMSIYIAVGVWVCVTNYKGNRLKAEVIEDLMKQNDLLVEQNKLLRGIIRKFGLNTSE